MGVPLLLPGLGGVELQAPLWFVTRSGSASRLMSSVFSFEHFSTDRRLRGLASYQVQRTTRHTLDPGAEFFRLHQGSLHADFMAFPVELDGNSL